MRTLENSVRSLLPSDHFPEYFKLDLRLGTEKAHPLAASLDGWMEEFFVVTLKRATSFTPELFCSTSQREFLVGNGYQVEELSGEEVERFFETFTELRAQWGFLKSIELLATIYFGKCEVRRGYPFKVEIFKEGVRGTLRPTLTTSRKDTIFIRLSQKCRKKRIEEFRNNAKRFVPPNFRIVVADPVVLREPATLSMDCARSMRLTRRRLPCPISQK